MTTSKIALLSPEGLHKNPAYSQVAVIEGSHKNIYVGGQNAVDKDGNLVGKGDIEVQARQVLQNLEKAVQAGAALLKILSNGMCIYCRASLPKKLSKYSRALWAK